MNTCFDYPNLNIGIQKMKSYKLKTIRNENF